MRSRILMFGWEFPPFHSGGLGVACLGLTRALASLGFEITFIMPKQLDVRIPWARVVGAEGIVTNSFNSSLTPYVSVGSYGRQTAASIYGSDLFAEVARYGFFGGELAQREQFDIIYAHDWLSFPAGLAAKRMSGKPLIVHVHATEFDRTGGSGINQHVYDIERQGVHEADAVIAVSKYTKKMIVDRYGVPAKKVFVVYNGIDETTAPTRRRGRPRLSPLKHRGDKLVLFLGRLTLQKGPDYFLRAAARVLEKNKKVVFVVSGNGDMQGQMMELAGHLGISSRVFFTGFLQGHERDEIYAAADLFVMPSVSEPFGIAALEALRMGKPVLVSKQSGIAEVIHNALTVDFWDIEKEAKTIIKVLKSPAFRYSIAERGRKEAEGLTWDSAAKNVDTVIQKLIKVH